MATADVDVGYLATHLGVPEANLLTLTTDPTAELVKAVLAAVTAKAHDFDSLFSQKLQLEVELEAAVRGAEAQRDASNDTVRKALKDVEDTRQKLKQEETTRQSLENEVQNIKSSSATSHSEVESLRARITSLETSNREALAIIDTKNSANDTLSQELQAQHQKNLKLNQEITTQQSSAQSAQNAANSAKFKEQALQQQVDMAQRSAEFYENELKTKSAEALKYRKEKGARIAELQRQHDDALANVDSLKRVEQQLRSRLDEAQKKADDGWSKVQKLQEAAARKEEGFRQELDAQQRLVNLKEQQTETHKNRLQEVDQRLDQVKREGESAVRRISEELAQAHRENENAATEIENLQAEVGRLEAALAGPRASPAPPGSAPQTPRPSNGFPFGRAGSPFATPGSTRKSISATQALEEMYKLRGLLAVEKQRTSTLQKEIDDIVDQLEAKGPEIEELQAENERLQNEIQNMSHLSDESYKEREIAKKAARKAESNLANAQTEMNVLRSQLRDLSAQMQMMIFSLEHRDQELTSEELRQFESLQSASNFTSDEMSDVDALVTERLVVFRNVKDLQEKNVQLLKVIHELSEQMKNEEDAAARQQAVNDRNENIRLKERISGFEDEFRSFKVRSESIIKERDMFRRLIEDRVSGEELASAVGREGVLASIEQNSAMNDDSSDYTTLLRDLQQNFDAYRQEQSTDRETMKQQVERLSFDKNGLQAEVSKLSSQLSLASERYEMLSSNFAALQTENRELQKRSQALSESAAKQDIRTQQVAEDLIESRGLLDSMRNENANLKAEKKLWKDIQDRLQHDNESLIQEKSRLNGLLATQQTLQNERDLSESETKRRLQGQIDALEAELSTTKRKLADEVEEGKKLQLRKEFDSQQAQKRVDELTSTLSQIREELVATKTSRDHLETRVNELTITLRSAEERSERLQPRPTPRPGSAAVPTDHGGQQDTDERIQELIHEVSDLKRDLELTKAHLENAREQAEQYKELSQAAEEELQTMNASQDQYAQDMDAALASKDATVKELQQRAEDLSSELGRSNHELSTIRDSQGEVARKFHDEKTILEEEVKRLKDQEENFTSASQFHQQDLRAQAEIAANAQQAYETEVSKHGETATTLSNLRAEYNQMKSAAATLRAEAESAKATLFQNEGSWDECRKKFEQELSELRTRREDVDAQNKLLHQQLESVSSQVTALQQNRAADDPAEALAAQPTTSTTDGLREINNYLRREKDILEVQFDLKVREAQRLQEHVDYTQSQLDEARLKLEQERRSQADSERTSMSHQELMKKLEELNLFRESSAALRAEARQAQAQLTERSSKIVELEAKIQPLEARVEELQSQQAFKEAEMKTLHEDRDRWQKRTEDILSKHGRSDPAEMEELKQKVTDMEGELKTLQDAETPLKDKIQELEKSLEEKEAAWQTSREKIIAQSKERSRTQTASIREITGERDRLQTELIESTSQVTTLGAQLEIEKQERAAAESQILSFKQQVQALTNAAQQNTSLGSVAPPVETVPVPSADSLNELRITELETELASTKAELENVTSQKSSVEQELLTLRGQLEIAISERDSALSNGNAGTANGDVSMENGAPEPAVPLTDEERQALESKIAAAEAKAAEFEAKAKELEENQDSIVAARSDKMKGQFNKKMTEKNVQMEEERSKQKEELVKQQEDFKLRLEQERKIWELEQPGGASGANAAPNTSQQQPSSSQSADALLNAMSDADMRKWLFGNATAKSIVTSNVKTQTNLATQKLKEEYDQTHLLKTESEQKVVQAREQAAKMASSKASLQVNMAENKLRVATAKISVVETAAKETPEKPVGEVWEVAKNAKPPPPPPKPAVPAAAVASPINATAQPSTASVVSSPAQAQRPTGAPVAAPAHPSGLPKPPHSLPAPAVNNPFAQAQQQAGPPSTVPANPFAAGGAAAPQSQAQVGQPAAGQPARSGIPQPGGSLPKSGLRQPSGTYQVPRGGAAARGRGGGRGGAPQGGQQRNSLNPVADDFQPGPGNKRPRGDSEIGTRGGAAKRARGGAGGGGQ